MKISIFSDLHFGYALNTSIENDSFDNSEQAIKQSLDSDLIIICGDLFDNRFPKPDTLTKAIKILSLPSSVESKTKLIESIGKDIKRENKGIPIVALHGTHERLSKDQYNAVQLLESAGLLYHLHKNGLIFENSGIKVAIQGMSGVPERYAAQILEDWSPKPVKGCYNILLLHQSIHPFIYSPLDPPSLNIDNLPEGFDLIVNGHIHSSKIENIGNKKILLTGSTIVTQTKPEEQYEKGIYKLILPEEKIVFEPLKNIRKFFYEEVKIKDDKTLREQIQDILKKYRDKYEKKPIVKFKIISSNLINIDKEMKDITEQYSNEFIIKYSKEIMSKQTDEKIKILRDARELKIPIEDLGMKILEENLKQLNFDKNIDFSKLYDFLSQGNIEMAKKILLNGFEYDKSNNI
ncbi:MAG: DNA repair exonuclease [Candidatus Aenigmarchaeota archaeon]|nr:DNA repair exonuclease [Candidatus Aenigmarchaeota archaeon]